MMPFLKSNPMRPYHNMIIIDEILCEIRCAPKHLFVKHNVPVNSFNFYENFSSENVIGGSWSIINNKLYLLDFCIKPDINSPNYIENTHNLILADWYTGFLEISPWLFDKSGGYTNPKSIKKLFMIVEKGNIIYQYFALYTPGKPSETKRDCDINQALHFFNKFLNGYFPHNNQIYNCEVSLGHTPYKSSFLSEFISLNAQFYSLDISKKSPLYQSIDSIRYKITFNEELTELESNINKLRFYALTDKLHWGKYSNQSIADILLIDPQYILWCIINVVHFCTLSSVFLDSRIRSNPQFSSALELNEIKNLYLYDIEYEKFLRKEGEYESDYEIEPDYKGDTFDYLTGGQYGTYDEYKSRWYGNNY